MLATVFVKQQPNAIRTNLKDLNKALHYTNHSFRSVARSSSAIRLGTPLKRENNLFGLRRTAANARVM